MITQTVNFVIYVVWQGGPLPVYLTRGAIFTEERRVEVNMPPRLDIEAMDLPTILYMIYRMVSA